MDVKYKLENLNLVQGACDILGLGLGLGQVPDLVSILCALSVVYAWFCEWVDFRIRRFGVVGLVRRWRPSRRRPRGTRRPERRFLRPSVRSVMPWSSPPVTSKVCFAFFFDSPCLLKFSAGKG